MPPALPASTEKSLLRGELRRLRRRLEPASLADASRALRAAAGGCARLPAARTLAGYLANDAELDVAELLAAARARGATTLLPRLRRDGGLDLVDAARGALRATGPGGLLEPEGPAVDLAAIVHPAVLLAPAVALDRFGRRLGRGGGAYDRLLARLRPSGWWVVGVCHRAHIVEALPEEPHDRRVDAILTEAGWIRPLAEP